MKYTTFRNDCKAGPFLVKFWFFLNFSTFRKYLGKYKKSIFTNSINFRGNRNSRNLISPKIGSDVKWTKWTILTIQTCCFILQISMNSVSQNLIRSTIKIVRVFPVLADYICTIFTKKCLKILRNFDLKSK